MKNTETTFDLQQIIETIGEFITAYGLKVIGGIVVLIIGLWIVKRITKILDKTMKKRGVDPSLTGFLHSLVNIALKALVIISVMQIVGVQMTSFIAVLGAAGLAVGLALQGTLQNFAGGALILALKPYKVGDYVETQGYAGIIKDIQIFNTIMTTVDNKTIILPNGVTSTSPITNYTNQPNRRVDWTFGVAYGSDANEVIKIIGDVLKTNDKILKDPATFIALSEMADSSVNFTTRAWTTPADYWDVYFDINKKMYEAFNAKGIEIPFPQMDVHLDK